MPIQKTVHVPLAGEVAFDASAEHEIRFAIEGDPPPGLRLARLTLVVSDLGGVVVYRAAWGAVVGQAVAIDGPVPPIEHVWGAIDNQGEAPRAIATISAPYLVAIHTVLVAAEELEEPPQDLAQDDEPLRRCEPRDEPRDEPLEAPPPCALTSLQLAASGATSASRVPNTLRVAEAGRPARLSFVAGAEDAVEIRWTLENAARATGGRLALYAADGADPVWQANLGAELVRGGRLGADNNPAQSFIDAHIRLDRAPLRLQLTLAGNPIDVMRTVAWTWIDVQVTRMRLRWGHARALAPDRADIHATMRPETLRQELRLLRTLKQQGAPNPAWRAAAELRDDDDAVGMTNVDANADDRLYLGANQYYRNIQEWEDDSAFAAHRAAWGDGPRLPIMVELMLRRASGAEVLAPIAALGDARVLWDWLDPQLDKHGGQPDAAFIEWALTRANDDHTHRSDDDSPASTNCHVDDGGKRGTGAHPVFPTGVGTDANAVPVGTHPFAVATLAPRPWAATSSFYRGTDPRYQGHSGALFQPSRMAGDAYRVRTYLWRRADAAVTRAASGDALWAAAEALGQVAAPHAQSGRFTVWRELSVVRYIKKNGAMAAIDFGPINAKLAHACMRIEVPAPDPAAVNRIWADGGFDAMLAGDDGHSLAGNNRLRATLLPPGARVATTNAFPLMSWTRMAATAVHQALGVVTGNGARDLRFAAAQGNVNLPGHPETWATALDSLALDDHAPLQVSVPAGFPQNLENVGCDVTSTRACFHDLATYLLGRAAKDAYGRVLSAMTRYHDQAPAGPGLHDPALSDLPGLHLFHFESVAPGMYDVSGAATSARGVAADQPWTRRRGIFYVCYTNWAEKIEIDMATNVAPTVPSLVDINIPSYLSQSFIDGAETQLDYTAFIALRMHSAAVAVLATMDARELGPGPRRAANTSVLHDNAYGLTITVKSQAQLRANAVRDALRQVLQPNVQTHARGGQDERKIYVSLVDPFSRVAAQKVKFWVGRNTLADSNKRTLFTFLSHVLSHVGHRVVDIHVYYRNTASGRARRDAVAAYINATFAALQAHVRVQSQHGANVFDAVYDLSSLATHELGHTLFLGHQHDNQYAWRHIPGDGFNCIMNYEPEALPANNHFCGVCNVGLRGWNTGTSAAHRFDDYDDD